MLLQISSGQGPAECSVGVEKLCKALLKEYEGSRIVSVNEDYSGHGFKSAVMEFDCDVTSLEGTVLWVWKSTIRPGHQRKNWYMDVHVIREAETVGALDLSDCEITTMHCGGKGGQHVKKSRRVFACAISRQGSLSHALKSAARCRTKHAR